MELSTILKQFKKVPPNKIRVLVGCEESQTVMKEFLRLGFDAYSCDLQECSGGMPERHFQEDLFAVLEREHFDVFIAHPPCTYLSNAGACRLFPEKGVLDKERYRKGLAGKEFFLRCLNYSNIKYRAIENPISSTVFDMPEHTQQIEPYMFGHPYTKATRLWLRNLPLLVPTKQVNPIAPYVPSGTGRKDPSKYGAAKRGDDAKQRSKTFKGIARAMAVQWGLYVLRDMNNTQPGFLNSFITK